MAQIRILLVEDSKDILFIIKLELEWNGYLVDAALDGLEGLKFARANRPDIIITDIQMPGLDGFEFIHRSRQIPALVGVPTIALTGFEADDVLKHTMQRSFSAHFVKPVEPAELLESIRRLTLRKTHSKTHSKAS